MKKILFILLVLTSCFYANAQSPTPKGKFFTGGSFGYYVVESDFWPPLNLNFNNIIYDRTVSFNINPQVGYMLSDNWAVGLGFNHQRIQARSFFDDGDLNNELTQNISTIFPFVRYYARLSDKFSFFSELNAGYGFGSIKEKLIRADSNDELITEIRNNKLSVFDVNIRPGINFFLNDRIVVEGSIGRFGYTSAKGKNENENLNASTFEFGINPRAFSLGVFYWFK